MFIVSYGVDQVYNYFRKHTIGAEVGVKNGNNARLMFDRINPEKFHLIDPWGVYDDDVYLKHVPQNEMEIAYQNVLAWANHPERQGRVELTRDYSFNAATKFNDGYFDWVYIDGYHDYENIYRDLKSFAPKIKEGGFLCGDDYWYMGINLNKMKIRRNLTPEQHQFAVGMIEGINDFCRDFDYDLLFITMDDSPKFFLAKKGDAAHSRVMMERILLDSPFIIEIDSPRKFRQDLFLPSGAASPAEGRAYIKIID